VFFFWQWLLGDGFKSLLYRLMVHGMVGEAAQVARLLEGVLFFLYEIWEACILLFYWWLPLGGLG
jgi:hypothetical protein